MAAKFGHPFSSLFGGCFVRRSTTRPASVKGKSSIGQAGSACTAILIFLAAPYRTRRAVAAVRTAHRRHFAVAPATRTGLIAGFGSDHAPTGTIGTHGPALAVPAGAAGNPAGTVAFFTELHGALLSNGDKKVVQANANRLSQRPAARTASSDRVRASDAVSPEHFCDGATVASEQKTTFFRERCCKNSAKNFCNWALEVIA